MMYPGQTPLQPRGTGGFTFPSSQSQIPQALAAMQAARAAKSGSGGPSRRDLTLSIVGQILQGLPVVGGLLGGITGGIQTALKR